MAQLDLKKLSRADEVVVGAAVIALIGLFLPWYGASVDGFSASVSGWSTSYGWLGGLLVVAAGGLLLALRAGWKLPSLPLGPAVLVLAVSLLGCLIVILRWATLPSGHAGVAGLASYSYGPSAGIYLVLIVGVVQAVAAFTLFRASGERLPWASTATGGGPLTGSAHGAAGQQAKQPPLPSETTDPAPPPQPNVAASPPQDDADGDGPRTP